eukprot:Em0002g580a
MEKHRLSRTISGSEQQLGGGVCLSLPAFVDKYSSHYLPRAVQIRKGTVRNKHVDLSEGSIITIYASAKSEMVSIQDNKGMVYAIPIDATSEFGLVCDKPSNQTGQSVEFRTAGDIAASLPTPKIVCALKSWGDDPMSSVEAGEVLIVVNASAKHLDLYSITTLSKKSVPAKCAGRFTTTPTSIKLPLFKLLHYFPDILPVKRHEKGSIIASYSKQQEKVVFSLPETTPIDIYVMPFYDHKFISPVYEYEREEKVKKSPESSISGFPTTTLLSFSHAQSQAGSASSAGVDVVDAVPRCMYDSPRNSLSPTKKGMMPAAPLYPSASVDKFTSSGYDIPPSSLIRTKKGEAPEVPLSPSAGADKGRLNGLFSARGNDYMNIDIPDSTDMAVRKANIEYLSSLDDTKVLKLLEKLDLSLYKKAFKKEKVNGYMMCRLDEETLERELGVKKHLHQLRLMEVITGKTDIRMYFAG